MATVDASLCSEPKRIGILAVHGIGSQKKGATLRQVGGPIVEVLTEVLAKRDGVLTIDKITTLEDDDPQHVTVTAKLDGKQAEFRIVESRWAEAFDPAEFSEMPAWLVLGGIRATVWTAASVWRGIQNADRWLVGTNAAMRDNFAAASESFPPAARKAFEIANTGAIGLLSLVRSTYATARIALLLAGGLAVGLLLLATGLIPLIVILLLASILWKTTRKRGDAIRSGLAASIGDAYTFERKTLDRAAMVQQVRDDLDELRKSHEVDEIIVVAHSLGAAVAYRALESPAARNNVSLFVTAGNALGAVRVASRARRFIFLGRPRVAPIDGFEWWDYYTSFDPVSGGELLCDTPARLRCVRIQNYQSVFRDHTSYFENAEQFTAWIVRRLLTRTGLEAVPADAVNSGAPATTVFATRVPTAAGIRRHRKQAQSASSAAYGFGVAACLLATTGALLEDIGRRLFDTAGGILGPLPDPPEHWLRRQLQTHPGHKVLGLALLLAAGALVYRALLVPMWKRWDRHAARRLVGSDDRLYGAAQLSWLAASYSSVVVAGVALALRARWDEPGTWYSDAAVVVAVTVAVFHLGTLIATHLTLAAHDLTPRGPLVAVQRFGEMRQAAKVTKLQPEAPEA